MLRDQLDRTRFAIILIGTPGIGERVRHYPQLSGRLGFSHQDGTLGRGELPIVLHRDLKVGRATNST